MNEYVVAVWIIVGLTAVSFYRLVAGPRVYNRLLASGAIGTNAIAILAVMGYIFERPDMFVDLALTYALLNFVGTAAVAKYLERHPEEAELDPESLKWQEPPR